jgi:uncharacterized protein (TIGR02611 family)
LVGTTVLVAGLFMVPFPGPGWLVVILGLAILSTEFVWAQRVLHVVREKVRAWTHWVGQRSIPVRILIGLATAAFVGAVLWGVFAVLGVPAGVPDQFVPPLPGL